MAFLQNFGTRLSAPIHQLKRRAKIEADRQNIPLTKSLNHIAQQEGFRSWSLLARTIAKTNPIQNLVETLEAGDFLLIGARPGHGKTMLALRLLSIFSAMQTKGALFTLEYHEREVLERFGEIGAQMEQIRQYVAIDCSDQISADHIIAHLEKHPETGIAIIDYMQLLDQKRDNDPLSAQLVKLAAFAEASGTIITCISQIDRNFELCDKSLPSLADVRLPNKADLRLFSKSCFIDSGRISVSAH